VVSVAVALVIAFVCGYLLLRAIARQLGRPITDLDLMRTCDLSGTLIPIVRPTMTVEQH